MTRFRSPAAALIALAGALALQPTVVAADFPSSYLAGRDQFRSLAAALIPSWPGAVQRRFDVPSERDTDLAVDYLYLPPQEAKRRLVVLTSGVHGAEAFVGSGVQALFLREFGPDLPRADTGYLLVHSLNPYGFRHRRRATENNVNLNRNFSLDPALYDTENQSYEEISDFLEPDGKPGNPTWSSGRLARRLGAKLAQGELSKQELVVAIGQGQFSSPQGIMWGGDQLEPQAADLLEYVRDLAVPYQEVVLLDIHTGLGDRYQLHVIPGDVPRSVDPELFERYIKPEEDQDIYAWTTPDEDDFYPIHGDINNAFTEILPPSKQLLAVTLEFGTMGTSLLDQLKTVSWLVLENQGFHNGYPHARRRAQIVRRYDDLFFPPEVRWRENVTRRSREFFRRFLDRMHVLPANPQL